HLTREEAFGAMETIMSGKATSAQIAAFLVGMHMKGETSQEIAGCAESMRKNALPVDLGAYADAVDLVGTGGDGKHTFNISTVSALVVAGAGAPVAKHGNRSVSSKCGSADVLKELGVHLALDNLQLGECLQETGIAFLFAPMLHPAMKHAIGPRREIGVRSVFNILGPISNPANVKRQLIGVYDKSLLRLLAEVLQQLESEHVMLVHSEDGMDEISLAGETYVAELQEGQIKEYQINPMSFGLKPFDASISGGDIRENTAIALGILQGETGPARDIVLANAAAGLYVAGRTEDLREGASLAANSIDSGAAMAKLEALRVFTENVSVPG
ncbi:MAG: anthranilate phosphoribosyltransferase, partial [bacterium]